MNRFVFILIGPLLLFACAGSTEQQLYNKNSNSYAHGFQIKNNNSQRVVTVYNPWEKARNISFKYFLINKNETVPDSLTEQNILRTPVQRVICLSTTHIAYLDALDVTSAIVGISGSQYISNESVREKISKNEIVDVGYGQNLNFELIVHQQPELVMVYGIGSEVTSYTHKLEELGIPVVMVAEYLEESPLGKAEWIKFVGALFEKEEEASQFFNKVKEEYLELKKLAKTKTSKPKVLVGSPYKDSWWVPGANSYMANLIKDAGGDYLGKENPSKESYVISFEHALSWANQADIWMNMGNLSSKTEILSTDSRFENFGVFKQGKIYNNIKRLGENGGNDFWESGTVYPNLVLRDLIIIFYPEIMDKELVYYQEIK